MTPDEVLKKRKLYYNLLYNFLTNNGIFDKFIFELFKYRKITPSDYIYDYFCIRNYPISGMISIAFSFSTTEDGEDYWESINKLWKNKHHDLKIDIPIDKQLVYRSIW